MGGDWITLMLCRFWSTTLLVAQTIDNASPEMDADGELLSWHLGHHIAPRFRSLQISQRFV